MAADDVRDDLAAVALTHMRTATSGCHCGGMLLGQSYPKHLADALMPVVDRIAREAAGKALRPFEDLFADGPDTKVRSTFRPLGLGSEECVEVTARDLHAAFARARAALETD